MEITYGSGVVSSSAAITVNSKSLAYGYANRIAPLTEKRSVKEKDK